MISRLRSWFLTSQKFVRVPSLDQRMHTASPASVRLRPWQRPTSARGPSARWTTPGRPRHDGAALTNGGRLSSRQVREKGGILVRLVAGPGPVGAQRMSKSVAVVWVRLCVVSQECNGQPSRKSKNHTTFSTPTIGQLGEFGGYGTPPICLSNARSCGEGRSLFAKVSRTGKATHWTFWADN